MTETLLYRVEDLVVALNLSRTVIFDLMRTGELRSIKVGRSRRVTAAAVHEFIAAKENPTTTQNRRRAA